MSNAKAELSIDDRLRALSLAPRGSEGTSGMIRCDQRNRGLFVRLSKPVVLGLFLQPR
jgi:hypothetical protein